MNRKTAPAPETTRRLGSLEDLLALQQSLLAAQDPDRLTVLVCQGTGCRASGAARVAAALEKAIAEKNLPAKVAPLVKATGCHGLCSKGPLLVVRPFGYSFQKVRPEDAAEIVETTLVKGQPVERLLYHDPVSGEAVAREADIPFYKGQTRVVLRRIGRIDPQSLDDAIADGAYQFLAKALFTMTPEQVLEEVEKSGLRGRGGAGFPTGRKWRGALQAARKRPGPVYVVVNGDEGDPGAFMDCAIMEGDPHAVLEGLALGAYALGARQGFLYVRAEYPVALKHLELAIDQARARGLLGENVLGSGFAFDVQINRGAGAFVCGESTALFASIEGKAGEPRPKYVRSVEEGLWGRPTVLNNVETWANVPQIIERGGAWHAGLGVPNSPGTKAFSLVGKVNNVGLVEVPMGTPLKDIVEGLGGGVPGGQPFKAVQTGGPSGGCVPYALKDVAVDFDSLTKVGSMMGSGGMIVMDQRDCVVDVARYFLRFLEEESCGKCNPCRLGLSRMREMLDDISLGKGSEEDLEVLVSLAKAVQDGALCALGGSAPNPVITTLRYFKDEYLAHIQQQRCPAKVCKALVSYAIQADKCTGCGACARQCPQGRITGEKKAPHAIDASRCIRCGACLEACRFGAVQCQ